MTYYGIAYGETEGELWNTLFEFGNPMQARMEARKAFAGPGGKGYVVIEDNGTSWSVIEDLGATYTVNKVGELFHVIPS